VSVLFIVEIEGPLPEVVDALQQFRLPPKNRKVKANWSGRTVMFNLGTATGTAFWLDTDKLTVLNINDRQHAGIAESVVRHLDQTLPYDVTSTLRFVA
jgi:hypothetical protein